MCGISGIFHFACGEPVSPQVLEGMSAVQRHRGPDGAGIHVEGRVGLANRRLAIVDRPRGQQPMATEDGTLWITYNGEVFNHTALRAELERRGHRFRTASDTEVVLQAYAAYGPQCVEHLNGQFAFALWDGRRGELFLARDRLGIVPLHYSVQEGRFLFASESKAILGHPAVRPAIDEEGVADALLCSALLGRRTLFQGIESLPPGHRMTVNGHGPRVERYWSFPMEPGLPAGKGGGAHVERFWELLQDSVRLRLMGEVPLGALLSGGTDSSTIAKLASGYLGQPLRTFTLDFPNPWKQEDRDASYASLMARTLGTDHRTFVVDPEAYFDVLERLVWHLERPFNKGAASMYLLYERVRRHATVVLCGEGADELLAGYLGSPGLGLDDVLRDGCIRFFPWAPYWRVTARLLSPETAAAWRPEDRLAASLAEALADFPTPDLLNQALFLYLRYFLLELLEIHDRTALASGVEARPPFLDHRLVEFLAPLPSTLKAQNGEGKALFKGWLQGFLPDAILTRKKSHMPIPRDPPSVYRQVSLTRDLLLGSESRSCRYFDPARLSDFLDRRNDFEDVPYLATWQITMYLITLEQFLRVYRL